MTKQNKPNQDNNIFLFDEDDDEQEENQYQNYPQQNQSQYISETSANCNNNNFNFGTFRSFSDNNQLQKNYDNSDCKQTLQEKSKGKKRQIKIQNGIVLFDQQDEEIQQIEEYTYQNNFQKKNTENQNEKQAFDVNQLKKRILFSDKTNNIKTIPKSNIEKKITERKTQNIPKQDFNKVKQHNNNLNYVKTKTQNTNQLIQKDKSQQKQNFSQFSECKKNQDQGNMASICQINNLKTLVGANIKNNEFKQLQYVQQKKSLRVNNMKEFLFTQISAQYKINVIIKKVNSGFIYGTKYAVFIQQNNKFLFSVLKDGLNKFIFSFSKDNISEKNKNYLGKLVWNFYGSEFMLFDDGFDPSQTKSLEYCHRQMAYIKYDEQTSPRKFQAIISTNNNKGFHTIEKEQNSIKDKWKEKQRKNMCKFYSKKPTYDPMDGTYKLDFQGMIGQPSIKNFILQNDDYKESLIFGRKNKEQFVVQIRSPFSLMQAVAICISSIHYKVLL